MSDDPPIIRAEIDDMLGRIDRVESGLSELRAFARDRFDEDTRAHEALQQQVTSLAMDIVALKTDIQALKTEMGDQTASLARIESAIVPIAKQFSGALANPRVRVLGSLILGLLIAWLASKGIRIP